MSEASAYHPEPVRSYRWRTWPKLLALTTWVVLTLLVLRALYLLRGTPIHPAWPLLALLGLVVGAIPLLIWAYKTRPKDPWVGLRLRKILQRDREANQLYLGERYAEAAELWEQACHDTTALPLNHALAVYNRGVCELVLGRPERALELIEAAAGSGWFETWAGRRMSHVLLAGQAVTLAVLGRLQEARGRQERAWACCPPAQQGMIVSCDALVEARQGAHAALLEAHPERAKLAAESGGAPQQRTLHLMRALALECTGGAPEAVTQALAEAPGLTPGSVDHLAARWPELAEFLDRRQLAAEPSGPALHSTPASERPAAGRA